MLNSIWRVIGLFSSLLCLSVASALEITITQGNESALPIAIAPFPGSTIVSNDLRLSGEFLPLKESEMISNPTHQAEVNYTDWRLLKMPTLVVGRITTSAGGKRQLEIQLINVYQKRLLAHYRFALGAGGAKKMRKIAHAISDLLYKKLTGIPGVFSTHVAYVSMAKSKGQSLYTLEIADADGESAQRLLSSSAPLLSPSWSPDGRKLAYVSFENERSEVWIQEVYSGKRTRVANFKGKNSAPAWSPDGEQLALSLSRDGNSEIYILNLNKKTIRRLTKNPSVDTEPAWTPDGKKITFLSDRSGRPQIYQQQVSGGRAERITFKGRYNTSPDWGPKGEVLTFLHGESGSYRIAAMEVESGVMRLLSDNRQDESPSFAPNGRLIVYATQVNGRGVLEVASVDGGGVQRLSLRGKDVREPAWSPYMN